MKSVWVKEDGLGLWLCSKTYSGAVRYVPASELAKVRRELRLAYGQLKAQHRMLRRRYASNADNARLRKAVEWALGIFAEDQDDPTHALVAQLASRAGLRWNGKGWVQK